MNQTKLLRTDRRATDNSTFAIGGVSCSGDSFLVKGSAVLRMNICAEKPAHRKSAKRWWQYYRDAIIDRTFPALHGLLPAALVSFDQAHSGA